MRGDRPQRPETHPIKSGFTPHARGSTPSSSALAMASSVYPACAGIDLQRPSLCFSKPGLPRMRGDRPDIVTPETDVQKFTPHARGSTWSLRPICKDAGVYPACAGIDPTTTRIMGQHEGLPRMRGDRPPIFIYFLEFSLFTPHARGSTSASRAHPASSRVYPACAGIDPVIRPKPKKPLCLPRMRGDRPPTSALDSARHPFTPHARGSTITSPLVMSRKSVYPACAGIDLDRLVSAVTSAGLPRMRGDRPLTAHGAPVLSVFTPHARGST